MILLKLLVHSTLGFSHTISEKLRIENLFSIEYVNDRGLYNEILLLTFDYLDNLSLGQYKMELEAMDGIKSVHYNTYNDLNFVPNDEEYSEQNYIDMIELEDAWDITKGSKDVVVGIIDTGIYAEHPDLKDKIDRNLSKSFSPEFSNPLEDKIGHGTNVAGIIGASGNNTIGICGVAMNATLVSLRTDNKYNRLETSAVIEAINYANQVGIDILNYSAGNVDSNSLMYEAIENYNGLFVCAAGNDSKNIDNNPIYPASYRLDNLISVGSVNANGDLASFSNYGQNSVDILAPGTNIMTTSNYGEYYHVKGTSFSSPIVAGIAALMLSNDNDLSPFNIKTRLMESVTIKSNLANYSVSSGIINAYNSVKHNHNYHYSWKDYKSHRAFCSCGEEVTQAHVVLSGSFSNGNLYAICLLCKGKATMGMVKYESSYKITQNGTYIMSNGVIVISNLDIKILKCMRYI